MRLSEVIEALEAEVLLGDDRLTTEVAAAGAADMVSDVLFFGRPGMLLLTGLTKISMIRAAQLADLPAVVFVRGKRPDRDAVEMARDLDLTVMLTSHSLYDSCGRLYARGLPGVIPAGRNYSAETQ